MSRLLYNGLWIYRLGQCQWDTSRGEEMNGALLTQKKPNQKREEISSRVYSLTKACVQKHKWWLPLSDRQTVHINELMQSKANQKHRCGRFGRGSRMQLSYYFNCNAIELPSFLESHRAPGGHVEHIQRNRSHGPSASHGSPLTSRWALIASFFHLEKDNLNNKV